MFIFGVIFALVAGILFGLIGPTTKIAYNAGASVGLAIFLRYAVASIIILPFVPYQKNLISNYKKNFKYFLSIAVGSIFLTLGLLTSVIFIEVSLTILIFCLYPIYVLLYSILIDNEKILLTVKILFFITFLVVKYHVAMKGLRLLHFQNVKKYLYQKERSKDVVILVIGQKLKNFYKQDIHILIETMMERPAKLLAESQINLKLEKLQSKIVMTEIRVLPVMEKK